MKMKILIPKSRRQTAKMSTNYNQSTRRNNEKKFITKLCKVCKDAGKSESEYTSHFVRDSPGPNGKTVCPTLLGQECQYCGEKGHTYKYCQFVIQKEKTYQQQQNRVMREKEFQMKHQEKIVKQVKEERIKFGGFTTIMISSSEDEDEDEAGKGRRRRRREQMKIKKNNVVPAVPAVVEVKITKIAEENTYASRLLKKVLCIEKVTEKQRVSTTETVTLIQSAPMLQPQKIQAAPMLPPIKIPAAPMLPPIKIQAAPMLPPLKIPEAQMIPTQMMDSPPPIIRRPITQIKKLKEKYMKVNWADCDDSSDEDDEDEDKDEDDEDEKEEENKDKIVEDVEEPIVVNKPLLPAIVSLPKKVRFIIPSEPEPTVIIPKMRAHSAPPPPDEGSCAEMLKLFQPTKTAAAPPLKIIMKDAWSDDEV